MAAGQADRELLGDQPLFILAEQLRADGKYFQVRQRHAVTGVEEAPANILDIDKLIGGHLRQFFLISALGLLALF